MKTLMIAVPTALGLVIACSAPPSGQFDVDVNPPKDGGKDARGPGPGTTTTDGGASGTGTGTGASPDAGGTKPGTPPTGECKPGTQPDDCIKCCTEKFPGSQKLDATFKTCMCTTPGVCKQQCGTSYCVNKEPSAACEGCQASEQCFQKTNDGCNADPTCKGYLECAAACNPGGQGGGGGQDDDEPKP